jgi:hypothetical protein
MVRSAQRSPQTAMRQRTSAATSFYFAVKTFYCFSFYKIGAFQNLCFSKSVLSKIICFARANEGITVRWWTGDHCNPW